VFIGTSDWLYWRQTRLTWVSIDHRHDFYFHRSLWSNGVEEDGYPVCGKYVKGTNTLQQNNANCCIFTNSLCTMQSPVWPYYTRYSTWTKYETLFSPWCQNYRPGYSDPTFDSTRPANWLWAQDYQNSREAFCQLCLPGHYKNTTANLLCSKCPPNSVTTNTGSLACESCEAGKTTDCRTGQVECVCDVGTESLGPYEACQTCRVDSFMATSTNKYANCQCVCVRNILHTRSGSENTRTRTPQRRTFPKRKPADFLHEHCGPPGRASLRVMHD
jgi:hypothetical protein